MLTRMVNCLPFGISQQLANLNLRALVRNQKRNHCTSEYHLFNKMGVLVLPALHDNYMYLIVDRISQEAAVVDPVKPKSVMEAVQNLRVTLTKVLTTHYHWDHAGGNLELVKMNSNLLVYGGDQRIGGLTHKIGHDSKFHIGNLNVTCLSTPGHTAGDICYFITTQSEGDESAVFCGDTLFLGGCGKILEGTPDQMYVALIHILSKLPDETKVFCGHEYTLKNLNFAFQVEPENIALEHKYKWCHGRRTQGKPTVRIKSKQHCSKVPSTIREEKMYNPFMRVLEPSVMDHVKTTDAVETMKALRLEKDCFKGIES